MKSIVCEELSWFNPGGSGTDRSLSGPESMQGLHGFSRALKILLDLGHPERVTAPEEVLTGEAYHRGEAIIAVRKGAKG